MSIKKEINHINVKNTVYSVLNHTACTAVLFEKCHFIQADLRHSKLLDCTLKECLFSFVHLEKCRLQNVLFDNCKIQGVDFTKCDELFLALNFKNCLIDNCNFAGLQLPHSSFHTCIICETCFINTNLTEANFSASDLKNSLFHNTSLSKAIFLEAINHSINPLTNKLSKAKFSKIEAISLLEHMDVIIE